MIVDCAHYLEGARQSDAPLAEVLGLLATLSEGWEGVAPLPPAGPVAAQESPWAQRVAQEPPAAYSSQGWSL